MPAARLQQFTALTGIVAVTIYGQTEQSGLSITEPIDEERRPGSLGKPLDQVVRWQLVPVGADADTPEPLPARCGEIGELWVRGDAVTPGYCSCPRRTRPSSPLYPQMVEGHLRACPLIAEVTVIGTAYERLIEQVTAIVVPKDPTVTADDIAAFCQSRPDLRRLRRPCRIEIVEEIPRTATNKIDRPALRARFD